LTRRDNERLTSVAAPRIAGAAQAAAADRSSAAALRKRDMSSCHHRLVSGAPEAATRRSTNF